MKVREFAVQVNAVYLAIGITMAGSKEVLGLWLAQEEGAKFWLQGGTELRNRGLQDIFISCIDMETTQGGGGRSAPYLPCRYSRRDRVAHRRI